MTGIASLDAAEKTRLKFDVRLDAIKREQLSVVKPWRRIVLDPEWRGPWIVAGDVNGDGECELVNARVREGGDKHPVAAVMVYALDGRVLWRWGDPKGTDNALHSDFGCQIHDWDGDGSNEVLVTDATHLRVLDGRDGKERDRLPLPKHANDCIVMAFLDGRDKPAVPIVKDRYRNIWALNRDGSIRWHFVPPKKGRTAHQPRPVDLNGDGRDDLIAGFCAIDGDGKLLWTMEGAKPNRGHLDCARAFHAAGSRDGLLIAATLCSGKGIVCVDAQGRKRWASYGQHYESIDIGPLRDDVPAPQLVVDITHGKKPYQDPLLFLDAKGRLFGRVWGLRVRQHFNLDWLGNGREQVVIPAGDRIVFDPATGKSIALLDTPQPRDLVPLTATQKRAKEHTHFGNYLHMGFAGDITGDGRQDIVLHTNPGTSVWIYRNTRGTVKKRVLGSESNFTLY